MAKKFSSRITLNAVETKRYENELYKSMSCTPSNPTGEFLTVGFNEFEQRSAINAIKRYEFGGDEYVDGCHKFHKFHPEHLGGFWGWMPATKVINGVDSTRLMLIGGELYTVTLPFTVDGGRKVNVKTAWLRAKDLGGNRLALYNDTPDKNGILNGVQLHTYLELLHTGVKLTVPVTFNTQWDKIGADGSPEHRETIHQKAVEVAGLISLAEKEGFEAAQKEYFTSLAVRNDTIGEANAVRKANEGKSDEERKAAVEAAVANFVVPLYDGTKVVRVHLADLKPGRYFNCMSDDKGKLVNGRFYTRAMYSQVFPTGSNGHLTQLPSNVVLCPTDSLPK